MKKILSGILAFLIALCIIISAGLFVIRKETFDVSYHNKLIDENSNITKVLKIDEREVDNLASLVVEYLKGNRDDMDVKYKDGTSIFNERELTHMEDVKNLLRMSEIALYTSIIVGLTLFLILFALNGFYAIRLVAVGFLFAMFFVGMILGAAAIWYYLDFSAFWTFFHKLVFTNDLWLMLPTDAIIILYTGEFFVAMVKRIFIEIAIVYGVLILLSIFVILTIGKQRGRKFAKR